MRNDYLDAMKSAGFEDVRVIDESSFSLDCMTSDPTGRTVLDGLKISDEKLSVVETAIASIKVSAVKSDKA